jgi:hypothetical protein
MSVTTLCYLPFCKGSSVVAGERVTIVAIVFSVLYLRTPRSAYFHVYSVHYNILFIKIQLFAFRPTFFGGQPPSSGSYT